MKSSRSSNIYRLFLMFSLIGYHVSLQLAIYHLLSYAHYYLLGIIIKYVPRILIEQNN